MYIYICNIKAKIIQLYSNNKIIISIELLCLVKLLGIS